MPAATHDEIPEAARVLRDGGVVLHATEGVWGFACDPFDRQVVHRILAIKGRSADKGLIVVAHATEVFDAELAGLTAAHRAAVEATWPGRHTWVLPDTQFPAWVTGGRHSVACRVPGHEQARALAAAFGGAIVSTSANRAGADPATDEASARLQFAEYVDFVLAGETLGACGASVIHGLDGRLLRSG